MSSFSTLRLPSCLAATVLLCAASACGSRSSLLSLEANEAGAPSSGGGGAGGGAQAAGAGGADTTGPTSGVGLTTPVHGCGALVLDGPPLTPSPSIDGVIQLAPSLVPIETDASRAGFVHSELDGVSGIASVASVALDDPWGPWPDELGTSAVHLQSDAVVGPGRMGRFSLLANDLPNNLGAPTGMVVWFPTAGVPGAQGQYFDDLSWGYPVFVTANQDEWLGVFQNGAAGGPYTASLARIKSPITSPFFSGAFACSDGEAIAGAAIPWKQGYLAAISSGRPPGTCLTGDLPDPPSRLQIFTFPPGNSGPSITVEYDTPGTTIRHVHAAPSKDGAWVAWERIGDPLLERRIEIVHLDASGLPEGDPFSSNAGDVGTRFSLAPLGDLVALATLRQFVKDKSPTRIDVQLFTANGDIAGEVSLTPEAGFAMDGGPSLLASPAGDMLLVAWEEFVFDSTDRRVRLARLACAGLL